MSENGYGAFITRHRKLSGYKSQRRLSEVAGVSSATLSRIEAEIQRPAPETLRAISKYLHTTTFTELMEVAGYWKGISEEERQLVEIKNEAEKQLTKTLFDLLKSITDDEGHFPIFLNEDIFNIFGLTFASEETKLFDKWYSSDYLYADEEVKDSNHDKATNLFREHYNYKTIKNDILQYGSSGIKERYLSHLKNLVRRHGIQNSTASYIRDETSPYFTEKDFVDKTIELSDEEILKQYNISVDGRDLTSEEARNIIAFVRVHRQMTEK